MSSRNLSGRPLNGSQKMGLYALLLLVVLLGAWVELRGAFLEYRRTDIGPYLRAAWAVRDGGDIYGVADDRGWHYVYPPLFAILMTPLADPSPGASRAGYIPYEFSVGIWYALTMALGFLGVHALAKALEEMQGEGRGRREWWALRVLPVLPVLPAIGRSQVRGQVGLLVAALLCLAAAALVRKKDFRSGLWLAAAVSIKVIPALLLLYPLMRRKGRMLLGAGAGLLAGLLLIPALVMGPARTVSAYKVFYKDVLVAGVESHPDGSRGRELTGISTTDSNSPMAVIHKIMYPDIASRPLVAAPWVTKAHWIIVSALIGFYLFWGWVVLPHDDKNSRAAEALYLCGFIPLMFIASPVFHPHYVSMALPLSVLMFYVIWEKYGSIPAGWKALFWFIALSHILTSIDRGVFWYLRDFGLVLLSTIALWAAGVYLLRPKTAGGFLVFSGGQRADAI